ncbi:hypothetical protein LshimejAT787_1400690 [Lyophyllum shimeji]|uniref:Uncharacterized protein n=1 Tax=Lyophyllum shimeji TaxID=47721 RepID=A0A9P3USV4_LYOSH|nr:hypothetical protein LshimejAT787_1400690 [Lyophyllum shimeji]
MVQGDNHEFLTLCAFLVFFSILSISFFTLIAFLAFLILLPVLAPSVVVASLVFRRWPSLELVSPEAAARTATSGLKPSESPRNLEEIYDEYPRRSREFHTQSDQRVPGPNLTHNRWMVRSHELDEKGGNGWPGWLPPTSRPSGLNYSEYLQSAT